MRKKIVAGNWKMNLDYTQAVQLAERVCNRCTSANVQGVEVILAPPFPYLIPVMRAVEGSGIQCAGQYCHQDHFGAHTGETSAPMIASCGATWVIVGHSERRAAGEQDADLLSQIKEALGSGLRIIFCCGEPLEVRMKGNPEAFVLEQLRRVVFQCTAGEFEQITLAYEPIWAIGTGKTATPEQAASIHYSMREAIAEHFGNDASRNCRILYGGSCKPGNAEALFTHEDVDGGLIGGASLDADDFFAIIHAAANAR